MKKIHLIFDAEYLNDLAHVVKKFGEVTGSDFTMDTAAQWAASGKGPDPDIILIDGTVDVSTVDHVSGKVSRDKLYMQKLKEIRLSRPGSQVILLLPEEREKDLSFLQAVTALAIYDIYFISSFDENILSQWFKTKKNLADVKDLLPGTYLEDNELSGYKSSYTNPAQPNNLKDKLLNKILGLKKPKVSQPNKGNHNPVDTQKYNLPAPNDMAGCLTRKEAEEFIRDSIALYLNKGYVFSLAFLDLDHFKNINDKYGHQAGDQVLLKFVEVVNGNIRQTDRLARWGGDEFIIIMQGTDLESAIKVTDKLCGIWKSTKIKIGSKTVSSTFSSGVAQVKTHGETAETILAAADQALYASKNTGRGKVSKARNDGDIDNKIVAVTGFNSSHQVHLLIEQGKKQKFAVIDADLTNPMNRIIKEVTWKNDWRIGPTASPVSLTKNCVVYGFDAGYLNDFDPDRDKRALREVANLCLKEGKKVLINCGECKETQSIIPESSLI